MKDVPEKDRKMIFLMWKNQSVQKNMQMRSAIRYYMDKKVFCVVFQKSKYTLESVRKKVKMSWNTFLLISYVYICRLLLSDAKKKTWNSHTSRYLLIFFLTTSHIKCATFWIFTYKVKLHPRRERKLYLIQFLKPDLSTWKNQGFQI